MITHKQTTLAIFAVPVLLLATAFLGNLFVDGFNWSGSDFVVAGILLFGTAGLMNLVRTVVKNRNYRILISLVIVALLILVWMELAVGIFGTPFAGS
ncbi:hypothetical protein [Chryseobacterium luquanense]|uniref:Uncharacterized protein n=1 Tax=Chryseobacterium luquanense TaxID=2983766 RepID=A0ABT3Y6T1_9FLAO|nr:hypothetical protein [Chryseobacterium luquanense]MCX8533862.1 hypothetical protein [Chryseobacterium luquanense]